MKEWIYKDGSGEYVLTTDPEVANLAADAVEVPIEAELYCFWHADDEKAFHGKNGFFIDGNWEDSSWSLDEIKAGESGAKILWQRQPNKETIDAMNDDKTEALGTKEMCEGGSSSIDNVNHPSHYCSHPSGIECIDMIKAGMSEEMFEGYLKGCCNKYLWRYKMKGGSESLRKAQWYLDRLIKLNEEIESRN